MHKKVIEFNQTQRQSKTPPEVRVGDTIKLHRRIQEESKERIQVFEGLVIGMKGGQSSSPMLTVRKIGAGGVGVELIVPLYSPLIADIEVVKRAKVRQAKIYFVRDKSAKVLRKKLKELPAKAKTPKAIETPGTDQTDQDTASQKEQEKKQEETPTEPTKDTTTTSEVKEPKNATEDTKVEPSNTEETGKTEQK